MKVLHIHLAIIAVFMAISATAQQKPVKQFGTFTPQTCGVTENEAHLRLLDPRRNTTEEFEAWLAPKVAALKAESLQKNGQTTNTVVTLPVVFHIIHNGDAIGENENISDEQVLAQLEVLNEDFRKMLGTNGYNTNPVGADMEVEFCMAQQDPDGLYTTGIERYELGGESGYTMEQVELIKPMTSWNPNKYINIWVFNEIYGLAGYAQFPVGSGLEGLSGMGVPITGNTDGIALTYSFVGSPEKYAAGTYYEFQSVLGHVATHELGHFFGLRHIWGDADDCEGTDYCDDTPDAAPGNWTCPDGLDSCPSPGLDMTSNYMDYTENYCQHTFTQGQKLRLQAVLQNSPRRKLLAASNGCVPGIVHTTDGALQIRWSLDPVTGCSNSYSPVVILQNRGTDVLTTAQINYEVDGTANTYTWNGSLAYMQQETVTLPALSLANGDHTCTVHLETVNYLADPAPANDTREITFSTSGSYETQEVVIQIFTDDYGDETNYQLSDENGTIISSNIDYEFPENTVQLESNNSYEFTADVEPGHCYTFTIFDEYGDGICCTSGDGYYSVSTAEGDIIAEGGEFTNWESTSFNVIDTTALPATNGNGGISLYPNPANSVINIVTPGQTALPESYTVYNSLGQVVGNGKVSGNSQPVSISTYANGVYFIKLQGTAGTQTLQFIKY